MTSNEVLAMYETLAGLTAKMSVAAQANDRDGLSRMENQCDGVKSAAASGIPTLDGAARQRKIALIKQIMANDRAIRASTEPWMSKVDAIMSGAH
ncbi:flagellar protein FliT [Massilia sp. S19_KUP03_FR1]|uniref:flagellar protein FliT n=1 Tax=Massilia sp. S19_KUP03_FR1 TaxID=3025503 RepID=UPI002FCD6376